jgi:spore coat polysaccharide biosynthesis protein SpsF (cytidylyltransferase family)
LKKSYTIVVVLLSICQPFFLKAQLTHDFVLQQYLQKSKEYKTAEVKRTVFNVGVFNPSLITKIDGNFFRITTRSNKTIYTLEAVDCTNGKIIKTPLTYQLPP